MRGYPGNAARLQEWITTARAADLPHLHAFTRSLDLDIQAATAALEPAAGKHWYWEDPGWESLGDAYDEP